MSLLLLFRGGGGTASGGGPVTIVIGIHKRVGVLQPDVPVVGGGHGTA